MGARRLFLFGLLPALLRAADSTPARLPSELTVADFFRPPQFRSVSLNPAGTHMAVLVFEEKTDSTGLRVYEFATKKTAGLRGTKTYDLRRNLGDPKQQQEKFEALSPMAAISQVKVPIFVAHGEEDTVADASQSHRLVRALKKAGVPCETMFASGESHGFASLRNRVELYTRVESFLKKNL